MKNLSGFRYTHAQLKAMLLRPYIAVSKNSDFSAKIRSIGSYAVRADKFIPASASSFPCKNGTDIGKSKSINVLRKNSHFCFLA